MNPLRWFIARLLLLFSLVGLVLAQEDEGQLIVKNSKKFHQPVNSNDNNGIPLIQSSSLSFRNIDKWELSDFLLVGTVDGSLQARDRQTGLELWSIPGDRPLIKVTNNNNATDDKDDEDVTWIIEPLGDGVLYYFIPSTGLKQLPVSIKQLVLESPFAIHGDDKVYTGSRHTTLYSINATNGDVIKVYGEKLDGLGKTECKVPNKILEDDDGFDFEEEDDDDYLLAEQDAGSFMIGRTDYYLEIHGKDDSIWNVTYSTWGPNNMDGDLISQHMHTPDSLYVTPVHNSSILALSTDGRKKPARWIGSVPSMVVTVFDVFKSTNKNVEKEPLVLLPQPQYPVNNEPIGTYIERTFDNQWFALSGRYFPSLVNSAPVAKWCLETTHEYGSKEELWQTLIGVHPLDEAFSHHNTQQHPASSSTRYYSPGISGPPPLLGIDGPLDSQKSVDYYYPQDRGGRNNQRTTSPKETAQTSSILIPSWWSIILRLVENIMTVVIIVMFIVVAARFGWLPQFTEVLQLIVLLAGRNRLEKVVQEINIKQSPGESEEKTSSDEKKVSIVEPEKHGKLEKSDNVKDDSPAKKRKRGSRGGRKNREVKEAKGPEKDSDEHDTLKDAELIVMSSSKAPVESNGISSPLTVSDEVIGYGSQGTVVYKGEFENRQVAVKRMVLTFYDIASQEVKLLQESDDHPNVIRYYCKHQSDQFLYIALELCPGSLEDIIERPNDFTDLIDRMNPIEVLTQITRGLVHLHSLKIVHRDIKPQNILVAPPKRIHHRGVNKESELSFAPIRMVISDFGLCKKLENDQSSFRPTTAQPAGTAGWTAPEISHRRQQQSANNSNDDSNNNNNNSINNNNTSNTSNTSNTDESTTVSSKRLTRAVDVFSLGCVFYYVLSNGKHPFGINSKRESNIDEYSFSLQDLEDDSVRDNVESRDLITQMIAYDPKDRPEAYEILKHPLFWDSEKKLRFLVAVSDWFDTDGRNKRPELMDLIEENSEMVIGTDWHKKFEKLFIENFNLFRKYQGDSLLDLLRLLRNKYNHFKDLPEQLQNQMSMPEGYLLYFTRRFPYLLITIYYFAKQHLVHDQSINLILNSYS